jgi:hypothetical protein
MFSGRTSISPSLCAMEYGIASSARYGSANEFTAGEARFMMPTVELAASRDMHPTWASISPTARNPFIVLLRMRSFG